MCTRSTLAFKSEIRPKEYICNMSSFLLAKMLFILQVRAFPPSAYAVHFLKSEMKDFLFVSAKLCDVSWGPLLLLVKI